MHQIKRLIEFHLKGHGIRQIERLCGISRNTIRDYLRKLHQDGRSLTDLLNLEDHALLSIVQTSPEDKNPGGRVVEERYRL
jgi:hypothetical protein